MTYRPSKETRSHLRDLYEMRGSYQGVADELNKGRRGDDNFTAYQVRQMLNTDRIAHGEIVDDPIGVRLTDAQKRSLQRKTKVDSRTYEKSFDEYRENKRRSEKTVRGIEERLNQKLSEFEDKFERAMAGGDARTAQEMEDKIREYQKYKQNLRDAKEQADNYQNWKGIRDKVS